MVDRKLRGLFRLLLLDPAGKAAGLFDKAPASKFPWTRSLAAAARTARRRRAAGRSLAANPLVLRRSAASRALCARCS